MRRTLTLLAGAAIGFTALPAAAQDGAVEWRVKDRFRLFDQASDTAKRRVAEFATKIDAAPDDADFVQFYDDYLRTISGNVGTDADSASLRESNYRPAGHQARRTSGRYERRYLFPDRYAIELRVPGLPDPQQQCSFRSAVDQENGPCGEWMTLDVADGQAVSNANWRVATEVIVTTSDGRSFTQKVAFEDQLVVALGDSYISGEGNPDVPSQITEEPDRRFVRPSWADSLEKDRHVREAQWWDEPCHRSLLSWPVIASFMHSARNPQHAVTLVHLGCSGAVVPELIDQGEKELPGGGDENQGQLQMLSDLVSRPDPSWGARKVDTTFLSIGGNDSGFAGVIATLALPPNGYWVPWGPQVVGRIAGAVCPYDQSGNPLARLCRWNVSSQTRLEGVDERLSGLAQALTDAGVETKRVFHALYPNALLDRDERPCDSSPGQQVPEDAGDPWSGFEGLMGFINRLGRGHRFSTWNFEFMYLPEDDAGGSWGGQSGRLHPNAECDWLPEPTDSEICQAMWVHANLNRKIAQGPFQTFEGHLAAIRRNGLCVQSSANRLALPLVSDGKWEAGWTPRSLEPYALQNERWFRVPNDSIVTQYGFHGGERHFHHGTAHPTFRAHVEVAKAAYERAFGGGSARQ